MDRFFRGWELTLTSGRILLADKRLVLFTLLSTLCTVLVAAAFFIPVFLAARNATPETFHPYVGIPFVRLFLFYIATNFIALFFNTALVAVVLEKLHGGNLSLENGFWVAVDNIVSILILAIISALFGTALRLLARFRLAGVLTALFLDVAWSVAIFLVVPVLVAEGGGPFAAISRSIELLRKTWGEQLSSDLGLGLVGMVCALPAIVFSYRLILHHNQTTQILTIGGVAVYIAIVALVFSTLGQIVRAAVYYYAQTGEMPAGFDRDMLHGV